MHAKEGLGWGGGAHKERCSVGERGEGERVCVFFANAVNEEDSERGQGRGAGGGGRRGGRVGRGRGGGGGGRGGGGGEGGKKFGEDHAKSLLTSIEGIKVGWKTQRAVEPKP